MNDTQIVAVRKFAVNEAEVSSFLSTRLTATLGFLFFVVIASSTAIADDNFPSAFRACEHEIEERFANLNSLFVKRRSFKRSYRQYRVTYLVRGMASTNGEEQSFRVVCRVTASTGEVETLDVSN